MPKFGVMLRVSSRKQAEKETIKTQEQEIRAWLTARGHNPDEAALWYRDDGVSGDVPIWERPAAAQLERDVTAGRITEAVVVYRVDRTSREDILSYFELEMLCRDHGIALRSIIEGVDTSTEAGEMMGALFAVMARQEKRKFLEASQAGHLRGAREGRWQGVTPFGYRLEGGVLTIHPSEAVIIRRIFELYAEEELSALAVGEQLAREGVRPRRGAQWKVPSLLRVLRNTAYIGTAYYNQTETVRQRGKRAGSRKRPPEEWIAVPAPPIVEVSTFERAQARLERHANYGRWKAKTPYLLRGLVICADCGATYLGGRDVRGAKPRYYYAHRALYSSCVHRWRRVPAGTLEEMAWGLVVAALDEPETWLTLLQERMEERAGHLGNAGERLAEAERSLARLHNQQALLLEAFLDGGLAKATYTERQAKLNQELAAAEGTRDELQRLVRVLPERQAVARETLATIASELGETADHDARRRALDRLIERIEVAFGDDGKPQYRVEPR